MTSPVMTPPAGREVQQSPPAAGGPPRALGRMAGFLLVCLELALVLAVVRLYGVAERNHFFAVACLAAGGFVVHAWLPVRFRPWFFCLLSAAGILLVLGWPNGGYVLGIGGALVAGCHLPLPLAVRAAVLAVAGLVLAGYRLDHDMPFWPVLGSMFMFRLVVYLHDLRRADARPPLAVALAYFFPLPNVAFPFFPILDFRTFRDTYQPDAPWTAAHDGVGWILRGVSHLLAYRAVKYFVLPSPHQLADLPHLALFLGANYALYLHVSGYFHVITGVFHLFGFRLPRTHHNYFLASSFTDIWRRINIPWKEFMAKIVFFPAFFGLRGRGVRAAAAAATAAIGVFVATWLFHAYQVFWLTGSIPLYPEDAGLWLVVGVLVAVNLRLDLARAGRPTPPAARLGVLPAARRAVQVVGMFVLVSLFWACWNTPGFTSALRALAAAPAPPASAVAAVVGVLLAVVSVGVVGQLARDRLVRAGLLPFQLSTPGSAVGTVTMLAVLVLVAVPDVADRLGPRAAGVIASLRRESPTVAEAAQAVQGYYEEITDARVPAGAWLAELEGRPRPPAGNRYPDLSRPADDFLEREPIPNWSGEVAGARLSLNRYGMRDRPDRTERKPPGTRRVAVLGSSVVMGYGVGDDETCARQLEDRLNARAAGGPRTEVLNFGTGRSTPISRRALLERKVWGFDPDAVYWVAHQDELLTPVRHLARIVAAGNDLPYPSLRDVVRRAGVGADTPPGLLDPRLQPFARDLVLGLYREVVADCRSRGVLPVFVYLPMPGVADVAGGTPDAIPLAGQAGFAVVDLSDWAGGRTPAEVGVPGDYFHVNAVGHRLVAERLDALLRERPELLPAVRRGP